MCSINEWLCSINEYHLHSPSTAATNMNEGSNKPKYLQKRRRGLSVDPRSLWKDFVPREPKKQMHPQHAYEKKDPDPPGTPMHERAWHPPAEGGESLTGNPKQEKEDAKEQGHEIPNARFHHNGPRISICRACGLWIA
jgi:hypothetical protein